MNGLARHGHGRERVASDLYYKIGGKSMGKRELFIVLAFAVIGVAVYTLTAPQGTGERPTTGGSILDAIRRGGRPAMSTESAERSGAIENLDGVSELKIVGFRSVTLTGEDRTDIVHTVRFEASGGSRESATQALAMVALDAERMGSLLVLTPRTPVGSRVMATAIDVSLPRRLSVSVEAARHTAVAGVQSITLQRAIGDVDVRDVPGLVSGTQRSGRLTLDGVGRVDLGLTGTEATIATVRDGVRLAVRNGRVRARDIGGRVDIDEEGSEVMLARVGGAVQIAGTDGQVSIEDPGDSVRVEVRAAPVAVSLAAIVPVVVFTTASPVRLALDPSGARTLDLETTGSRIDAAVLGLTPEDADGRSRLVSAQDGAPPIVIRNQRGTIEITERK